MKRIYSVGQVNHYIRSLLAGDAWLSGLFVRGEVSNCKYHSSGHIYFSLKDETGTIAAVMFARDRRNLAFPMKNGDRVVVSGRVDVYEKTGAYQLYASAIRREGAGELYERYMKLKAELEERGLFSPMYKKPVPPYAKRVGIVTSPTGAAVRDIQNIAARRNPYVQLILCPALVQGDGAKESIVRGIRRLDRLGVDVIIVGRGGGSIEDLWAFNEECVAEAIFACRTPVISAVGHETDTTISDFVADLRAPTPSAAAELAVFDYQAFLSKQQEASGRLAKAFRLKLTETRTRSRMLENRLMLRSPGRRLADETHRAAMLEERMRQAAERRVADAGRRAERIETGWPVPFREKLLSAQRTAKELSGRLSAGQEHRFRDRQAEFRVLVGRFKGLNPLERLNQGYAYAEGASGRNIRSIHQVQEGETLAVCVTDGRIYAAVTGTCPEDIGFAKNESK